MYNVVNGIKAASLPSGIFLPSRPTEHTHTHKSAEIADELVASGFEVDEDLHKMIKVIDHEEEKDSATLAVSASLTALGENYVAQGLLMKGQLLLEQALGEQEMIFASLREVGNSFWFLYCVLVFVLLSFCYLYCPGVYFLKDRFC